MSDDKEFKPGELPKQVQDAFNQFLGVFNEFNKVANDLQKRMAGSVNPIASPHPMYTPGDILKAMNPKLGKKVSVTIRNEDVNAETITCTRWVAMGSNEDNDRTFDVVLQPGESVTIPIGGEDYIQIERNGD